MSGKLSAMLIFGAAIAWAQSDSALLFSECSDASSIQRVIQSADLVEVRHSLAGGAETCYAVSVKTGSGEVVEGFLMGARHPAVIRFERQEESYIARAFSTPTEKKSNVPKTSAHRKRVTHNRWNPFSTK